MNSTRVAKANSRNGWFVCSCKWINWNCKL